jgi:DNA repair photolyase
MSLQKTDNLNVVTGRFPNKMAFIDTLKESEGPKFNGPVSGPMWAAVNSLDSAYPDNFDWSAYDRLYNRYGANQPRGGVVFKTTFKLVNHHQTCTKCHYSFEIDSYGRGCVHNCVYCYAKEQLSAYGYWNRPMPFPVDLSEVRKIFYTVFETNKYSKWRDVIEKRVPLRIGSMSDSFMWMDKTYGVTKELLRILNFYKYPYVIFTRSDLVAHEDYLPLIDPKLGSVQFSISGNNEKLTKLIEPGAPSVKRRFEALRTLSDAGIWTAIRVNPLFPLYPDGYFTDRESVLKRFGDAAKIPKFSLYDDEFFSEMAASKANTVIAGFVRLSSASINAITKETGVDLKSFFLPEVMKGNNDKHYSDKEIAHYYRWFKNESVKHKFRFTTCYIGNGAKDYYQYQKLWDNKKDCCDIVSNVQSFKATSQSVSWDERIKHSPKPECAKENQQEEAKWESIFNDKKDENQINV